MDTGAVVSGEALLAAAAARTAVDAATYKADDLTYDVGLLAAFDAHPVDPAALAADREAALLHVATENAQLLIKRGFELPVEMTSTGPVVRCVRAALRAMPKGWARRVCAVA